MSNYIVLVKQVPDVSQITDNAFNPETGTLIRSRLSNVINDLDAQALAFANKMITESDDKDAQLIALTMGPPMAEEVLRYSLARCADKAVLLTDRALGGADTWATANPLAYAVRKIQKEIFKGNDDFYIVAGMQSVDGDTAQVPAQMAEELEIPCVAYATDCEFKDNKFEFTRIISGGSQVVSVKSNPAVITIAKYEHTLFAGFAKTRKAQQIEVTTWGADDINATAVGAKGSKTRVIRVFPPGKSTRKSTEIQSPHELADILKNEFLNSDQAENAQQKRNYILPKHRKDTFDRNYESTEKEVADYKSLNDTLKKLGITDIKNIGHDTKLKIIENSDMRLTEKSLENLLDGYDQMNPSYSGQVWVVAEHADGVLHDAAFELIGKARDLADSLDTKVGVCLIGNKVQSLAEELIHAGADEIYLTEHPLLETFDPASYRKALSAAIEKYWPQIVLFAATPQGRVLAPMVSYRVGCGLTADCTSLDIHDNSRKGEIAVLLQTRPALGGNIMATIMTINSRSQMATARPGVMKRLEPDTSRTGKIIPLSVEITPEDISLEVLKTEHSSGQANFNADIIVSGGKGMQNRDNYDRLLTGLCSSLDKTFGVPVEKGASRAAVEQGFTERVYQVGQTGTAVGPKLYFALGISGAIQHMIGVANTNTIVAINSDPNAPIFKQCDYYLVGTVEETVPQLIQAFEV